jgi:hypothetical protein
MAFHPLALVPLGSLVWVALNWPDIRDDLLTRDEMHEFAENGETTGNGQN